MDFWGFTLAGGYLPSIIAAKNVVINRDLKHTYRSYVYIYLPGIVGVLLGGAMYKVPAIGRKWSMVISSALMGISIFLFSAANSNASNIGLNGLFPANDVLKPFLLTASQLWNISSKACSMLFSMAGLPSRYVCECMNTRDTFEF